MDRRPFLAAAKRGEEIGVVFDDGIHTPEWWLMTREEYIQVNVHPRTAYSMGYSKEVAIGDHQAYVEHALEEGYTVPQIVLESIK